MKTVMKYITWIGFSFFLNYMTCISFSCPIALDRTGTMLIESAESRHPCLVPYFMKAFSLLPLSVMLAVGIL